MSNQQQQQQQQQQQIMVKSKLLERLEMYRGMMVENKDMLDQLIVRTDTTTINMVLLSRLDDVMEDIATLNADTKSILDCLSAGEEEELTLSVREPQRITFQARLKTFMPMLFFWHTFLAQ